MFKKLFISSIAASLLLALPVSADRHHHGCETEKIKEKVAEKLAEVKAQEKSIGEKAFGGTLQALNKLSWLIAIPIAAAVAYYAPVPNGLNENGEKLARGLYGVGSWAISTALIRTVTAATMSQENIKPLKK